MDYVTPLIEAAGGIIASVLGAVIAGGYISKAFEKNISPLFTTYADKKHDAHKLMRSAKDNIYVVAGVGDRFLVKYEKELKKYLRKGVNLRFLIQASKQYYEFEHYINVSDSSEDANYDKVRETALEILRRLKEKYPNQVEVKAFSSFLTASYIGIDIEESDSMPKWQPHAIIQVMIYQYGVPAENSPITYFSVKRNRELFESTANSISEMWHDGKPIDLSGSDCTRDIMQHAALPDSQTSGKQ